MITAVTSKFKDIIGQNTYVPESRKRTLDEEEEEEEILRVGVGEPARKRSRPLAETEEPISRSFSVSGQTILKGTAKRLSNIWSWMSSLITPTLPNEDVTNTEVPSNEISYLGTSQRSRRSDVPTKRPAISRRSMEIKRDQTNLPSIDGGFRFSPTITSTTAKGTVGPSTKSQLPDRYLMKNSAIKRSVLSHHKKSSFLAQAPVKRLYDIKYPLCVTSKNMMSFLSKHTGRGKACIQESFRHEEKMQYKKLLQQCTQESTSSHFNVFKVPSMTSLNSNSRSTSPQGIITRTRLDSRWTKDKLREFDETKPKSPRIITKPTSFTSSQRLLDNGIFGKKTVGIGTHVPLATAKSTSESSTHGAKEAENDCVIIAEDIKVRSRRNSLERSLLESPVLDENWYKELHDKYNNRAKMKTETAKKIAEHHKMCIEVRKQARPSMEDRIANRIKLLNLSYPSKIEEIVEENEEEEEEELPELTPDMIEVIEDALDTRAPGQVLVDKFNIQITRRDIATLSGLNWLNDEVINFYMNLLMERGRNDNFLNVHAFNTFFYPKLVKTGYSSVRRWTKKVDVFSHDLLLVPVHLGMHWCLATVDFRTKYVRYYDSMLGDNDRCLEALLKYLESEHLDKKQSNYDTGCWTLDNVKNIPQQMNGSDCGMFACKFSEYLSRDVKITFDQQHMPYFRRRMIYEIVSAKLL